MQPAELMRNRVAAAQIPVDFELLLHILEGKRLRRQDLPSSGRALDPLKADFTQRFADPTKNFANAAAFYI
jgi:hypothetical protein